MSATRQDTQLAPWNASVLEVVPTFLRQVVRHDPPRSYGDCYRTTIACLLGASDPTDVPHFVADSIAAADPNDPDPPAWADLKATRVWLREVHDLDLFPITPEDADEMGVHYKATVISPTGVHHSVIGRAGRVVWCPAGHPIDALEMIPGSAWVISRPWTPDPDGMVDEWRQKATS